MMVPSRRDPDQPPRPPRASIAHDHDIIRHVDADHPRTTKARRHETRRVLARHAIEAPQSIRVALRASIELVDRQR
jgi:hypothetical protein